MRHTANEPSQAGHLLEPAARLEETGRVELWRAARPPAARRIQQNLPPPERVASGLLGGLLVLRGAARRSWGGLAVMGLGACFLRRAASGRCALLAAVGADTRDLPHQSSNPFQRRMRGRASIGVQAEPTRVQEAWREQANLPVFLNEAEEGRQIGDQLWQAELVEDVEGRLAWRSRTAGSPGYGLELTFTALPTGRGTRVDLELDYLPARGVLGAVADRFRLHGPRQRALEALRRAKRMIELGSIPSIEGQARGQCGTGWNGRRSHR